MKSSALGVAGLLTSLVAGASAAQQLTIQRDQTKDSKFGVCTFIENNINFATDVS